MMERYLIQDRNYTIFIIKSNAPVEAIKEAMHNYLNDHGSLEYARAKATESERMNIGELGFEELIAKRIVGYLKGKGYMVGELALGDKQTNDYTQSHFGGTWASSMTSIVGSGADPAEGMGWWDIYHNAKDKEPITVVVVSVSEGTRVKKNIYHKRMEPKHIKEVKRYVRGVLNRP